MDKAVEIYKALGNGTRLSIVRELARRNQEVQGTKIIQSCSSVLDLAQPTLSQHFSKLVACGALNERKKGTEKFYSLNKAALKSAGINLKAWRRKYEEKS